MAEAVSQPEYRPNDPALFESCVGMLSVFGMTHGRPKVARLEHGQWRYFKAEQGAQFDVLARVCEVDDRQTGQPRMMLCTVSAQSGADKTGLAAELVAVEDPILPPPGEEDLHMPSEESVGFRTDGVVVYERYVVDPTGAWQTIEKYQLPDEQLADLEGELKTLRPV